MSRLASQIQVFITGNTSLDEQDSKLVMLRGQFALLGIFIGVVYAIIVFSLGDYSFIPWHILLITGCSLVFFLNRKGKPLASTLTLFVLANSYVFLFTAVGRPQDGMFFYYFITNTLSIILIGYERYRLGIILVLITLSLAIAAYVYPISPIPLPENKSEHVSRVIFLINLIISLLFASYVLFLLMRENLRKEESLLKSQRDLINTSAELLKSQERFELAVQGTRTGIYEWQAGNGFIYLSEWGKILLGYDKNESLKMTFQDFNNLVLPEDRTTNTDLHSQGTTEDFLQREIRLLTKSGDYRWFSDTAVMLSDEKGQVSTVVGSIADIHDRKKAEEELSIKNIQLAKTNEELDRFVYSASHDMRAPLSSLLGLISVTEKSQTQAEMAACFGMMRDRIRVMEGFIQEVTDYSRNARTVIVKKTVHLRACIESLVEQLKFIYENKRIQLTITIPEFITLSTDEPRFKVVVNNLISNAIKYSDPEKTNSFIIISASINKDKLDLSVEDNGLGIGDAHVEKVFDMFFRASTTSEGSGLGLYIVKETLQKLNGEITVTSKEGIGSCFTISLPID